MTFDLCFVTYNSKTWLKNCVGSFARLNYDKKNIHLYFADNASSDDTVAVLHELQKEHAGVFGAFEVIETGKNLGFGGGSNRAAKEGSGNYVFLCNVDTEIHENAFIELEHAILENEDFSCFELRQFPYEHPKFYNPITLEVGYASGACFVLRRDIFETLGGFDESIFMYAEDVDLSWRARLLGHKIRYVPKAIIQHYAYKSAGEVKPVQSAGSVVGSWVLRAKFAPTESVNEWNLHFNMVKEHFAQNPDIQVRYEEMMSIAKDNHASYRAFYKDNVKDSTFIPDFSGFDFCFAKSGAFYENELPAAKNAPFFSVLVRTYKRPDILRFCLQSLLQQTYPHYEVVVCEDGESPISEAVVNEFKDKMQVQYHAMCSAAGRCLTANKAIELAKGDYLNMLDDDDYFFPEHLEVAARQIELNPDTRMFTMGSVVMNMESDLDSTLCFKPQALHNFGKEKIEVFDIFTDNQMPIQAVTFHKSLTEEAGVFDNIFIDGYEDWELWARYMMHTKNMVIPKATSCYRVPTNSDFRQERAIALLRNIPLIREKFKTYEICINAGDLFDIRYNEAATNGIINEYSSFLEMRNLYEQTVHSNTWRKTNGLRKAAATIWRNLLIFSNHLYGPCEFTNLHDVPVSELMSFTTQTRKSLVWRLAQKLANRRAKP